MTMSHLSTTCLLHALLAMPLIAADPPPAFTPRTTFAEQRAVDQATVAAVPKHPTTTTDLERVPMWAAAGTLRWASATRVFPAGKPLHLRIDAGTPFVEPGWEYQDKAGNTWFADQVWSEGAQWGAVGGGAVRRSITPDKTLWYVPPPDAEIYTTERYGMSAYRFRLPPGRYTVQLQFVETFKDQVGSRVFEVTVNGQPFLTAFDPLKEAGGFKVPVLREVKGVAVGSDGRLELGFSSALGHTPTVNGIQIVGEAPLAEDFTFEQGRYCRGVDDPALLPDPGRALFRVACGLLAEVGWRLVIGDQIWLPDVGRNEPRGYGAIGGGVGTRRVTIPFTGGAVTGIYRNERYGVQAYEFDVPPGTYTARLHFADGFECVYRPGGRVFDVTVQGRVALDKLDPFVAGGGLARASVFDVRGVVVDAIGVLRIGFTAKANSPAISGIEVFAGTPGEAFTTTQVVGPAKRVPLVPTTQTQLCRVLYVGNSMTFFWAIPQTVAAMVNAAQPQVWHEPYRHLIGGYTLPKFFSPQWQPQQAWKTIIEHGKYDYVVLQDAIGGYAKAQGGKGDASVYREAMANARSFIAVAKAAGSRVIYYAIDDPTGYAPGEESAAELDRLVKEQHLVLIPAGAAVNELMRQETKDPHGLVFANDGVHYGIHSAYLVACLHTIAWTGRSIENNPSPYLVGQELAIEPAIARYIEAFAWRFFSDYAKRHDLKLGILPEGTFK